MSGISGGWRPSGLAEKRPAERLRFQFRYQPWKDVLDWFADQNGLSLIAENMPKGTFNYTDSRQYTPAEALDVLNSVLQIKGFVLLRRERMLYLHDLESGPIPPGLVPEVREENLDKMGEFELVRVLFSLQKLTAEEGKAEVEKLLGPQGSVVVLSKSRQISVTETVGRCGRSAA